MLFEAGLDGAFLRHRLLGEATRRAVDIWSQGQALGINVVDPAERSDTVTTVRMAEGRDPQPIRDYCNQKCGVILGHGIGALQGKAFRIAHMGHVNAPMILGTLGTVEVALEALAIPHGSGGVQAAIQYLGEHVKA
jgi:alanine-glyoxylate transaminase/serine-glyoxylate transaminase/serine-pyruvate transaminase